MSTKKQKIRKLKRSLMRVGVELVQYDEEMILRCVECGGRWSPHLQVSGRRPANYKRCPFHRCNQLLIDLAKPRPKKLTFPW